MPPHLFGGCARGEKKHSFACEHSTTIPKVGRKNKLSSSIQTNINLHLYLTHKSPKLFLSQYTIIIIIFLIVKNNNAPTTTLINAQTIEPQPPVSSSISSSGSSSQETTSSKAALCFGGLQTFEKISMSSFENPIVGPPPGNSDKSNNNFFGSGPILIQQDDQALTSECVNLCRSQSNCLSFVIDYNKFECKSYATTQQELQNEFEAKFQASRAANNNSSPTTTTQFANPSTTESSSPSSAYQTSSSNAHFQQLLPSASSNYFEKICLDGVANRHQLNDMCGNGRLWTIERVVDSFLDGFVEKELTNVNSKDECSKLCIFETQFVCRSADYDQQARLCRLSKEDRRTQPQAMRYVANSNRQYLENQCASPGPSSCIYETKKNVGIISMDALKFAQTVQDCQMKCNQESTFNCRSYSFFQQRCFLSGDDSYSLDGNIIKLPNKNGWNFGEKKCLVEVCTKGIFSYEKITGYTLRSALSTPIDLMTNSGSALGLSVVSSNVDDLEKLQSEPSQSKLRHLLPTFNASSSNSSNLAAMMMLMMASKSGNNFDPMLESASSSRHHRSSGSNLAVTNHCRQSCDLGYLNCPAFTIDYKNNRCQRLDRNSQGRHHELVARDGFAYFEKICLRVTEMMSMCQDKYWIFERVIGYELAPRLYNKTLKFVSSRRDCEEYCLEEKQFQCRSALYNDETSDCKLSSFDRRLIANENAYYRNFNTRISYLENQCIRDRELDRSCNYEKASDEPSYPTFTDHIEMVPAPTARPSSSSSIEMEFSDKNFNSSRQGVAYCEQLCNDNARFECHSFGYYSSTAQCFLSGDDTISAGQSAVSSSTGFIYYEKKCNSPFNGSQGGAGESTGGGGYHDMVPPPGGTTTPLTPTSPATDDLGNPYFNRHRPASTSSSLNFTTSTTSMPLDTSRPTTMMNPQNNNQHPPTTHMIPSMIPSNMSINMDPDQYKCGSGHTFVYQRISGFEPIGGYLTLLVKDNEHPGIVAECSQLCKKAYECRAFIVDYDNNQCFAMLENSSVGLLSLRQTIGKDYFEGFCVADQHLMTGASCGDKIWVVDKILDQAVVGVEPQKVIPDSDRVMCRQACIEERIFWCKSAMFDSSTHECRMYSIDRESIPQMRLLFSKGMDFFENQCQIVSSACPYDAIERGITIVTATRSTQARSMFECESACNAETQFNCRSFTYLDQYPSLPNLCVLSSDSRSTSQRGSIRERQRTLYAERNCFYRRPRYPGGGGGSVINDYDTKPKLPDYKYDKIDRPHSMQVPGRHLSSLPVDTGYGELPSSISENDGVHYSSQDEYDRITGQVCEPHQFSFERTFGYDFRNAHKERAPIPPTTVGISIGCQQECMRRGDRCQSFVVEYSWPYQSCFLIEAQAGSNRKALVKSPNIAYFEKICLPKFSGSSAPITFESAPQPLYIDAHSTDIAPSYSQNPWTLQQPNQLPYHLLPHHQQYSNINPSRSCAKLWTFERFINYNFTAPVDKTIENVLSRAKCEAHCMDEVEFKCQALTYDYSSSTCRLFKHTRRTIMSRFVDLDHNSNNNSNENTPLSAATAAASQTTTMVSNAGTIQIIPNDMEKERGIDMQSLSGNTSIQTGGSGSGPTNAKQIVTRAISNDQMASIDYVENTCVPGPSSCQYRQIYDSFSQYIDKITHALSLSDCQRQCDSERLFSCRSINYDPASRNCMLINEDLVSLNRGQQASLMSKKNTIYSEKGNCELISVQCNPQEMLVSINFDSPFRGKVLAKGNPEKCFMIGDGQTNVQFQIVFGPKCNSRQEGHNTFVNEIVIQQHPIIMTENDKTVRVMCAFEAPEQTLTLQNPLSRENNKTGIDVSTPEVSRTRHDKQPFNSVVSNKASPPRVVLRILDQTGRDASMINLGDELTLKIHMQTDGQNSALGIFARNLAARSSNGESLLLIDNDGCPVDHQVFPALEIDHKDGKSLQSTFKAFRFPSNGLVNFEVQIKFCPERCEPVDCSNTGHRLKSLGRRKRESGTLIIQPDADKSPVDALSTKMEAGKAFQYIRELMLAGDATPAPSDESSESTSSNDEGTSNSGSMTLTNLEDDKKYSDEANMNTQSSQNQDSSVVQPPGLSSSMQNFLSPAVLDEPIVMHVDEKVMPSDLGGYPMSKLGPSSNSAPYGLPMADGDYRHQSRSFLPPKQFNKLSPTKADPSIDLETTHAHSTTNLTSVEETSQNSIASSYNKEPLAIEISQEDDTRSKEAKVNPDIPLKFSILVGNAPQPNNKWIPGTGRPTKSINTDDVVIPGKSNQSDGSQMIVVNKSNIKDEKFRENQETFGNELSNSAFEPSLPSTSVETEKLTITTEEQTFDAQPSTSVTDIQPNNNLAADKVKSFTSSQKNFGSHESSPTTRGCQNESTNSRFWVVIYTGSIVVALNICLVLASCFIYFRRTRNHNIASGSTDCASTSVQAARQWRSVFKNKDPKQNLGTSLNQHSFFFRNLSKSNMNSDLNWPNLSSSSAHSTISSLAEPMPITKIMVNHDHSDAHLRSFNDAQSSLRGGRRFNIPKSVFNDKFVPKYYQNPIDDDECVQNLNEIGETSCSRNYHISPDNRW